MTSKEWVKKVKGVITANFLNKVVNFENSSFEVRGMRVKTRSKAVHKSDWDDYGVDENTQCFIEVMLFDDKSWDFANDAVVALYTVNTYGQLGTCEVPFDYEYEEAGDTFTSRLYDMATSA